VAVTTNGSRMVDDVSDPHPVRDELSVASDAGEAVGGGLLAVRGGDNGLCNAGACQVTLCQCGQPLKTEDRSHGIFTLCCGRQLESCCGE
jgi:hypothetical protein